jgi:hypothetical protein
MKLRVFVFTPAYLVVRRIDVESDDSESAIETAKFELSERNREDPDATFWTKKLD